MNLPLACSAMVRWGWWRFVAWCGGPKHPSYAWATFHAAMARHQFVNELNEGTEK